MGYAGRTVERRMGHISGQVVRSKGGSVSEREVQGGDGETGECHICGRIFSTQEELSKHLMDDHDDEKLAGGD
jgi:uncharacterized C2H2 Zn-finger protein